MSGLGDLIGAVVRIADSLDRAVALLEDLAEAIELPAWYRDTPEEREEREEEEEP